MKLLTLLLLPLFVLLSLWAFVVLPGVRDTHSTLEWFFPPGLAIVLVLAAYKVTEMLEKRPHLINVPSKERFLALTPARRRPVVQITQRLMQWLALEAVVLMGLIQLARYHKPDGPSFNVYVILLLVFGIVVSPMVALVFVAKIQKEVTHQFREQQKEEDGR